MANTPLAPSPSPVDGFRVGYAQPFEAFSGPIAARFYDAVTALAERMHVTIDGLSNVPEGRALLVANHSFGYDVVFAMAAISKRLNRRVWALGEHLWWRIPFVRRLVAALGVVDGTPENTDRLLSADELVVVLPGGLREAVKPRELRYQLLWGQRYGFVRAALRNRAPMVPLAGVGADELFDFVGNPFARGQRLLGKHGIPLPVPRFLWPLPTLKPLHFVFGEPVHVPAEPFDVEDATLQRRLRREVEGGLHELIEEELARRLGIDTTR